MKNIPRVLGDIPIIPICYKYNSWKFLGFLDTVSDVSTNICDPYLYRFTDTSIKYILITTTYLNHKMSDPGINLTKINRFVQNGTKEKA